MAEIIERVDRVEILTLQDNYIDMTTSDNNEVVTRARMVRDGEIRSSLVAEHGFSALVSVTAGAETRHLLFDFGFSAHATAFNADALDVDLSRVESLVLSHGHIDHLGGLPELAARIPNKPVDLVLHPAAFRRPRYIQAGPNRIRFPEVSREGLGAMGVRPVERSVPHPLLGRTALFLGEIPRATAFEHGMRGAFYEDGGEARADGIEDDSAIVVHVRDRGLVVLSGCAHAGIVNTVHHAREITGVRKVCAIMGGFHLASADPDTVLAPTVAALREFDPAYVIPTHCTGRKPSVQIEREMPEQFLLNMVGTRLTFAA